MWTVFITAFCLRLTRVFVWLDVSDPDGHLAFARNINQWHHHPPGYGMFLAPFSGYPIAALTAQSLLGALTAVMVFKIAERTYGKTAGLWAGFLCAVSLGLIDASGIFYPAELFTFLTTVGFYMMPYSGVAWGLAAMTRIEAFLFTGLFAFSRYRLEVKTAFAICFLIGITPLMLRSLRFKDVDAGYRFAITLWGSNNPEAKGRWLNSEYIKRAMPKEWEIYEKLPVSMKSGYAVSQSIDYIKSLSPKELITLIGRRYAYHLQPSIRIGDRRIYDATFVFILPFAVLGLIAAVKVQDGLLWIGWLMMLLSRFIVFAGVGSRYRCPSLPLACVLASGILCRLWQGAKGKITIMSWAAVNGVFLFCPHLPKAVWHVFV